MYPSCCGLRSLLVSQQLVPSEARVTFLLLRQDVSLSVALGSLTVMSVALGSLTVMSVALSFLTVMSMALYICPTRSRFLETPDVQVAIFSLLGSFQPSVL